MDLSSDVSVVIPVYSPGPYFRQALESVIAQNPGEVLLVDDASPAPLPTFCQQFPQLRILRHETNRGPGAARNTGLAHARGRWVSFNDHDDLWAPGKLTLQLRIAQDFDADIVVGLTCFMAADGTPLREHNPPRHTPNLGSMLVRREVALRYPQDETSFLSEDLDFYLQAKEAGVRLKLHDDEVFFYRRGIESLTSDLSLEQRRQSLFRTLSRSLVRRRESAQPNPAKEML